MRPFNLEQALAGQPVCTRDGRPVTQLVKFDCDDTYPLHGVVHRWSRAWDERGLSDTSDTLDLFMAPVKKTGWVVRCRSKNGEYINGSIYANEEKARNINSPHALSYHQIEWEE